MTAPANRASLIERQQAVLDAMVPLQVRRSRAAARFARIEGDDEGRIVASGDGINEWLLRTSDEWRELVSVRTASTPDPDLLHVSLCNNRALLDGGLTMQSVYDDSSFDDESRRLIAHESFGYRFAPSPLQMKVIDRSEVLLQGPTIDGAESVMCLRSRGALADARRYWRAVCSASQPASHEVRADGGDDDLELTDRQRDVVALLGRGLGDPAAAAALGVSVRTLRAEVGEIKRRLGVTSRFAAGLTLGRLESVGTAQRTG